MIPVIYDEQGKGFDVYSRLLEDRIIMIQGGIDDDMASSVVAQILLLSHKSSDDIHIYINSGGGSVTAGLAIIDTMNLVDCEINTYCIGMCASMGAMILSQGERGKRFILPNAHTMIHQVAGGAGGTVSDMEKTFEFAKSLGDRMETMLAKATKKTKKKIKADWDRDNYMNSDESVAYGLVDSVLTKQ